MSEIWWLIQTLAGVVAIACLLRVWGARVSLHPRDMLMHFSCTVTDWLVLPIRKLLPLKPRQLDFAGLFAAGTIAVVVALMHSALFNFATSLLPNIGIIALQALGWLIGKSLYLVLFIVLAQAILSWVNPNAPVAPALTILSRPLLAPIRKYLPAIGGIDFSALVLVLAVQVLISLAGRHFPPI